MTEEEFSRIKALINKRLANPRNELEARLFPRTSTRRKKMAIDYYKFKQILERYIFRKDLGGFGLKKKLSTQLNVKANHIPNLRESIQGEDAVKSYSLTEDPNDTLKKFPGSVIRVMKRKGEICDLSNYAIRVALSDEEVVPVGKKEKFTLLGTVDRPNYYRLQNRISVFTEDGFFRIDFSTIKEGSGHSFRQSKVLSAFPLHEIEIEFIGSEKSKKEEVLNNFIHHLKTILSVYYNSPVLTTQTLRDYIKDQYKLLINKREKFKHSNRNKALTSRDFIAANAVTLQRENIIDNKDIFNILRNYAVTYKADGQRNFLFIVAGNKTVQAEAVPGSMYLLNNNFVILPVGLALPEWSNTLVEGEYIEEKKAFYAYDILYAKNLDIRGKPLQSYSNKTSSRIQYLEEFVTKLNASMKEKKEKGLISVRKKPYLFSRGKEIFGHCADLWKKRHDLPYKVDGLIFTPSTEPYPREGKTWPQLFKWKPKEKKLNLNTIDFLIKFKKDRGNRDQLFPYVATETAEEKIEATSSYTVNQYKIAKLFVGGVIRRRNSTHNSFGAVPFREYPEAKLPVSANGRIMAFDPLHKASEPVMDDTIVEFAYYEGEEFPWKPIRVRHDKTSQYRNFRSNFGNNEKTASSVWRSIQIPVTEKMITTGEIPKNSPDQHLYTKRVLASQTRLPYQIFHTVYIKDLLLKQVALQPRSKERGAGNLVDFGASRGGDLNRWNKIGYQRVVGIDLDPDSVQQATTRYESGRFPENFDVVFVCGNLSKTIFPKYAAACPLSESKLNPINWQELMKIAIPRQYLFDVVSSQFVIHYLFSDELSLRSYFQNVTDCLRVGGKFVGSTFNGQRVFNYLKRKKKITGKQGKDTIWEITKEYGSKKFTEGKPNWGMKINVYVASIGLAHTEYLVSFEYLKKIAAEYGLKFVKSVPFEKYWQDAQKSNNKMSSVAASMSEDEKIFSFFSSSFLFVKEKNAPDSTYKKLVKLQRRKRKA